MEGKNVKMSHENEKKQFKVYFSAIMLVVVFGLGILTEKRLAGEKSQPGSDQVIQADDMGLLEEVSGVIGAKYAGELPDKEKLVEGAAKGLVASLGDPYTVFWDPEEAADFMTQMEGSFEGIGAEMGMRDQMLTVIAPLDGMPADKAGVKAGDVVLKIGDEITTDMSTDEAVKRIRGPKGTKVKLTIYRKTETNGDPLEIEVTRDTIDLKSVKWEQQEDGIGYVRVSGFLKDTKKEFEQAVKEMKAAGVKRIVLDVRNNPGGFLETSIDLAGAFLERNSLVVTEDYGEDNKSRNKEHRTTGKGELKGLPVVILVNEGTASSAEILAGALRDDEGAILVGEQTFGKGSVQELADLKNGSSLKITVAKWLTPKGSSIDKEGLRPDIEVKPTEEEIQRDEDQQLEKALEVVKEK